MASLLSRCRRPVRRRVSRAVATRALTRLDLHRFSRDVAARGSLRGRVCGQCGSSAERLASEGARNAAAVWAVERSACGARRNRGDSSEPQIGATSRPRGVAGARRGRRRRGDPAPGASPRGRGQAHPRGCRPAGWRRRLRRRRRDPRPADARSACRPRGSPGAGTRRDRNGRHDTRRRPVRTGMRGETGAVASRAARFPSARAQHVLVMTRCPLFRLVGPGRRPLPGYP